MTEVSRSKDRAAQQARAWYIANREAILASRAAEYAGNADAKKERVRAYAAANKPLIAEREKQYRATNSAAVKERKRERYQATKDAHSVKNRRYYLENKGHLREENRRWIAENRSVLNEAKQRRHKILMASDLSYRLTFRLRSRLYQAIKGRAKGGSAIIDLGCSIDEFKAHIARQFQSGMMWDNWGFRGWHLDHIRPLASFDLADRTQFLEAAHWSNYQPLWWRDNIRKNAQWEPSLLVEPA